MQYTLRNVPDELDAESRRRATRENKSLNQVAIPAMARGVGTSANRIRCRDLTDVAGRWLDDPELDAAIAEQDRIDQELWD